MVTDNVIFYINSTPKIRLSCRYTNIKSGDLFKNGLEKTRFFSNFATVRYIRLNRSEQCYEYIMIPNFLTCCTYYLYIIMFSD
jgi:hypothetical protein